MPQAQRTYEVTAPNGKVLEITGDHAPTEAELREIFATVGGTTAPATPPQPLVRSRTGQLYTPPTDTGPLGTFASRVLTNINPLNIMRGGKQLLETAATDPAAAGEMLVQGAVEPFREIGRGDIAAGAGDLVGMYFAGKGLGAGPRLIKGAATEAGTVAPAIFSRHLVGVMSPRAAHALQLADDVRAAVAAKTGTAAETTTPASPGALKAAIDAAVARGELRRAPVDTPPMVRDVMGRPAGKPKIDRPASAPSTAAAVTELQTVAKSLKPAMTLTQFRLAEQLVRNGFTKEEALTVVDFLRKGKTAEEAVQHIQAARDFQAKFGTPGTAEAQRAVTERNATGRWKP